MKFKRLGETQEFNVCLMPLIHVPGNLAERNHQLGLTWAVHSEAMLLTTVDVLSIEVIHNYTMYHVFQ